MNRVEKEIYAASAQEKDKPAATNPGALVLTGENRTAVELAARGTTRRKSVMTSAAPRSSKFSWVSFGSPDAVLTSLGPDSMRPRKRQENENRRLPAISELPWR